LNAGTCRRFAFLALPAFLFCVLPGPATASRPPLSAPPRRSGTAVLSDVKKNKLETARTFKRIFPVPVLRPKNPIKLTLF